MEKYFFVIGVIVIALASFAIISWYMPGRVGWNLNGQYQPAVIEKIKSVRPFDSLPILSWNTSRFGRIYASVCSAPLNVYPCIICTDGGVSYYNAQGNKLGICNSMGRDGLRLPYTCANLLDLNYEEADYISRRCDPTRDMMF